MPRFSCHLPTLALVAMSAGTASAATYPLSYQLPRAGRVSAAVYDDKGVLVRELLRALPQGAGPHTLIWDGLGADGKGSPPGRYVWKLLQTQGLSVEYQMSVGSNYPVGTDLASSGGPGTHLSPFSVATDETGLYVAAFQTENIESGIIKIDPEGKRRLWSRNLPLDAHGGYIPWEGARSIAVDKGRLFLLGHLDPQRVHVSDAATSAGVRVFDVGWDPVAPDQGTGALEHGATDMDVRDGVLVVAYKAKNAVRWYDPGTGTLLGSADVPSPSGVTVGRGGAVFVTTHDQIVRLTLRDRAPTTIATHLHRPGRLDADDDELFVYQAGTQQILRLSTSGLLRQTYGAAGGRRDGLYVDRDFAGVTDLVSDGSGGFFVAEAYAAPRRVAHVLRDGSVAREWYGGQPWDTSAVFEPGRPDVMWVASAKAYGHEGAYLMRVLVDLAHRTWRVHSCYKYLSPANPLLHGSWNEGNFFHVYAHDGTNYVAIEGTPTIWRLDEAAWRLVPATVVQGNFQWNDANGDGRVQDAEVIHYQTSWGSSFAVPHLDASFALYAIDRSKGCVVRRLAVTGWNAGGAPLYGTAPAGEVFAACPARFVAAPFSDSRWGAFLFHDPAAGNLYGALNPGTVEFCTSGDSFMQQWNAEGRMTWQVGEQGPASVHNPPPTLPGQIYWNLRGIAGVAHGCVVAIDVDGGWTSERAQTYVWDRDGLFVGGIMDNPKLEGIPAFMYHCGGEFAHATLYTLPDGDVIFAGNWENETRLYRVTGWDTPASPWLRVSGALTVRKATPDDTGQGLVAESFRDDTFAPPSAVRVAGPIVYRRGANGAAPGHAKVVGVRLQGAVRPRYGPRYFGHWRRSPDAAASDGGFHGARNAGARVTLTFHGTSVAVIGVEGPSCGTFNVTLDASTSATSGDCRSLTTLHGAVVFERKHLKDTDHTLTLEVVEGRRGFVGDFFALDGFVVDGGPIDDDGIAYSFYTRADRRAQLWIDGRSVINAVATGGKPARGASNPEKLLRTDHSIQLDVSARGDGSASLEWSSAFDPRRPIPASALFPVVRVPFAVTPPPRAP